MLSELANLYATRIGTAQVMTFAIPLSVFGGVIVYAALNARSGHDPKARRGKGEPVKDWPDLEARP